MILGWQEKSEVSPAASTAYDPERELAGTRQQPQVKDRARSRDEVMRVRMAGEGTA